MEAAVDAPGGAPKVTKPKASPTISSKAPAPLSNCVADCGCDVLPWDDCVHTARA